MLGVPGPAIGLSNERVTQEDYDASLGISLVD